MASEPFWRVLRREISLSSTGIRILISPVRSVIGISTTSSRLQKKFKICVSVIIVVIFKPCVVCNMQRAFKMYCSFIIYRVIHKSVKHFKNSQQIDYSTDHGNSYAERERNSPRFFYIFHRCSMCPPLVIRQTSMR